MTLNNMASRFSCRRTPRSSSLCGVWHQGLASMLYLRHIKLVIVYKVFLDLQSYFDCLNARKRVSFRSKSTKGHCITSANLHIRNFSNCQHPADEKSRQHIVVTHAFSKPYLHLQTVMNTPLDDSNGKSLSPSSPANHHTLTKSYLDAVCLARSEFGDMSRSFGLYVEYVDMPQTAARNVYDNICVVGQYLWVPSG